MSTNRPEFDDDLPGAVPKPPPLRVPLKVWKDPDNDQIYIAPVGLRAKYGTQMKVFVVAEGDAKFVDMTVDEWNSLPFFYFKEDGLAPRQVTYLDEDLPS